MQKDFKSAHALRDLLGWWRYKRGVAGPRAADPVLSGAELARMFITAATAREQHFVDLPNEPQRQWKPLVQPAQTVVHGSYVIGYFLDVFDRDSRRFLAFEQEQIGE